MLALSNPDRQAELEVEAQKTASDPNSSQEDRRWANFYAR